ncbi:hypothetical protein D3C86_756820 [compost metagenome]
MALPICLFRKTAMAINAEIQAPVMTFTPKRASNPSPAPATLPILNARPPRIISSEINPPNPGNSLFAISCALISETAITRQIFNCTPISIRMDTRITNPKLAPSDFVKTVVCVRKPGPIADVAISNAAPISAEVFLCFIGSVYRGLLTFG